VTKYSASKGELTTTIIYRYYLMGKKCFIVNGLPGGGKTRFILSRVAQLANKVKVIYASPLRVLRDWASEYASRYTDKVYVIKSKFESCDILKERIEDEDLENYLQYLYKVIQVCSNCSMRKEGKCEFGKAIFQFIHSRTGFWCMTHHVLYLLTLMLLNVKALTESIVIIDEAEQYADLFRYVCDVFTFERLKQLAQRDKIWKDIVKRIDKIKYIWGHMIFLPPIFPQSRLVILVSATLTIDNPVITALRDEEYLILPFYVHSEINDVCIVYPKILIDKRVHVEEGLTMKHLCFSKYCKITDEFLAKLCDTIVEIYDNGYSIGIACRNHALNHYLTDKLKNEYGLRVYSEVELEKPPKRDVPKPYVVLWTTRGKWFRGVSLPETEVVICFYQNIIGAINEMIKRDPTNYQQNLLTYLINDWGIEYPIVKYQEINYNVQSFYRTNRVRSMRHYMVFIDVRSHEATLQAFRYMQSEEWYYKYLMNPKVISDISEITKYVY